jgi:Transposase
VEGTGCYGAGLARFLTAHDQVVLEVNRPDRSARRRRGKSDPVDAEAAARAVLAGQATSIPKAGDHLVEMVRCLRVARASAAKARTQTVNALRALVVTAPAELRERLRDLPAARLASKRRGCGQARSRRRPQRPSWRCACWVSAMRPWLSSWPRWMPSSIGSPPRRRLHCGSCVGSARRSLGRCWSRPGTTPDGSTARPRSRCCVVPPRSRPPRARRCGIAGTGVATARPTPRCTGSWWCGCAGSADPGLSCPTNPGGDVQARDHPLSQALCGPRGLRRPTHTDHHGSDHLTIYRSITTEVRAGWRRGGATSTDSPTLERWATRGKNSSRRAGCGHPGGSSEDPCPRVGVCLAWP